MRDMGWLLAFARPATGILALSAIARILGHGAIAAALVLPAWALGALLGGTGGAGDTGGTWATDVPLVVLLLVIVVLLGAVLRYVEQLTGHLAAFRLLGELRIWVMEGLLPQAPAVVDTRGSARVLDVAVHDVERIEVFFAHTIAPAISAVVIPVAAVATAGTLAGWPMATAVALVLLLGWVVPLLGRGSGRSDALAVARLRGDLSQHVADSLRLREVITQAGTVRERLDGQRGIDDRLGGRVRAGSRHAGVRATLGSARVWGGMLAVLLVGLLCAGTGSSAGPDAGADPASGVAGLRGALPGILAATVLVPGTANGLETLERLASSLPAGLAATRRVRRLAAARPEVPEPAPPRTAPPMQNPAAALEHAHFSYSDRRTPVLEDVHLHVDRGTALGVVGPSGSGKSTIARLLQRHVDPTAGHVEVRGVDARALGSSQVQRLVAVADQDPFLLDASIAENLRLAAPDATDEELEAALEAACADLPLARRIGVRGGSLSGGERQRLALARTLLRAARAPGGADGAVLVLDEATSHQDPITQEEVMRSVERFGGSLLVIAHREAALRRTARVVRVEDGRIVDSPDGVEELARCDRENGAAG